MKKRLTGLLVLVTLAGAGVFVACTGKKTEAQAANEPKIVIKIAHVVAEGNPIDQAARRIGDILNTKTDGRITVDVFPASALGGNRELLEQLQLGTLEMCMPSVAFLGGFTDTTALLDLPYLFRNNQAAEEVLDGEVGQAMFADLEKSGFVGLVWFDTGWRHLTANEAIRSPAQMKGKKIRVMENQMHIDHFNALGASAIPMAFSEVFTALQNKTIDCQENPYANIEGNRFFEVQKYIIETGHIYDTGPLLVSKKFWDKLSDGDKKLITDSANEVLAWERDLSGRNQNETRAKYQANSFNEVILLTPEERDLFRVAAQPVYDKYVPKIGADLIKKVDAVNQKYAQ